MDNKNLNPSSCHDEGFFSSLSKQVFEELADSHLAVRIISAAMQSFPSHWTDLMNDDKKRQRFFTTLTELWKDMHGDTTTT